MTKMKKVIAMMLALLMAFSSMSVMAMAWDVDEMIDTELSIRTEFLKEEEGNWVVTEKVIPGQAVKARIYVGTNYYSNDSELLFHYDDSFFDVAFEDGEVYDLTGVNTEAGVSAMIMNFADEKVLGVLVDLDSPYNAMYDDEVWLFDIPLTVKSTATGKGRIYVDESDVRNTDNQDAYINVPAGPEGGSSENFNQVISMDHWDVDSIVLDNPYVSINSTLVFRANTGAFTTGDPDTFEATGAIGSDLTVPTVEKEGFVFRGWTEEADVLPYADAPEEFPIDDAEYYAYWDKTVEYVFDANGGYFDGDETHISKTYSNLVPDADFTAPANPEKPGYTFLGWDKEVPNKVGYAVSESDYTVTYTANWAKNVTVRFFKEADDASALYTFTGYAGQSFSEVVDNPSKPGSYFAGWDPEMPTVFPDESTDYVAQWEERTFTVNYFVDGEFRGSAQVGYNTEVNFNYPSARADYGFQLGAWHLGSEDGEVIPEGYKMPGNNINVYSKQEVLKNLPAVFKLDASDTEAYDTKYADFDAQIETPADPSKAGYNFLGWEPQVGTMDNINGKTFVALWEPASVNVTFYVYNDAGEYEKYDCLDVPNGENLEVPADPYMDGYTFQGWATTQGQTTGKSAEEIAEIVMDEAELNFYEARTANTYKVNFVVDGGTAVTTPQNVTYGNDIILPETTRTGYDFAGWKDEGGATHTANYKIPALGDDGEEMTLTAQWTIKQYKIIFKDYNGSEIKTVTKDYNAEITASDIPAQPTREGYFFTQWTEIPGRMPAVAETIVTAQYSIESYTYAFDTLGGNAVESITENYGEAITAPSNPVKSGYEFAYWYINNDSVAYTIGTTMPDLGEDGAVVTLKAKWNATGFKITFNSNGGSDVEPINAAYNSSIAALKPEDPTKTECTFAYWYEDGSENTPYVFDKMPAKNFTLNAKWNSDTDTAYKVVIFTMDTAGDYVANPTNRAGTTGDTITFDDVKPTLGAGFEFNTTLSDTSKEITADGKMVFNIYVDRLSYDFTYEVDGVVSEPEKVYFGAQIPQLTAPDKTGYKLDYWFDKGTGDTFDIATETMPAKELNLKAKFSAKYFDSENGVKFDANTGAFADSTTEKTVAATFGQQFNAPVAPTKYGYTFMGWAESSEKGATVIAAPGEKLPALAVDLDKAALTYYAVWQADEYSAENGVQFDANGGKFDGGDLVKRVAATFGETFNTPDAPSKYGYEFLGWASTKTAEAAEEIPALAVDLDVADLIYYAVWKAETYEGKVTFNANGGKFVNGKNTTTVTATFGEEIASPDAPSMAGYNFVGWTAEGSDEIVAIPGNNLPALSVDLDETELTYFAKWSNSNDTAYTVTVYTMDATGKYDKGVSNILTGTTGSAVRFDAVKPALAEGFKFGSHDVEKTITADGKMVFSIYVDRNEYNLSYVADGKAYGAAKTVIYGAAIAAPSVPIKSGHTFNYWYVNDEAVEFDFTDATMPANDLVLTAKFTTKSFTEENGVKFNANNGVFSDNSTEKRVAATFGETYSAPADPTRKGYTFKGWAEGAYQGAAIVAAPGAALPALSVDLSNDSLTYYAVWEAKTYPDGVTFDANNGKFAGNLDSVKVTATFGKAVPAPEAPTRAGYDFAGWAASASSSAPIVAPLGADLPVLDKDLATEELTYFAKWNERGDTAFTIVIYSMNADGSYAEPSRMERSGNSGATVYYADEISNIYIPAGFEANEVASDDSIVISGDGLAEMKVYLDRIKYKAYFKNDTGYNHEVEALYGAAIVAPEGPNALGREFVRWADAEGNAPSTMPLNGTTFKAVYENKTYRVSYYVDGEFVGSNSIEYGSVIPTVCATYVTEEGYEFEGWYVGSINGSELEENEKIGAADVALYGKENAIKYRITFKANGGKFADETEEIKTTASLDDYTISIPSDPTRKGYTFAGWTPEVGEFSTIGDKTYTAVWEPDNISVIFYSYNDTGIYEKYDELSIKVGKTLEAPSEPYTPGYTFKGWATEEDQTSGYTAAEIEEMTVGVDELKFYEARTINKYNVAFDENNGTAVEDLENVTFDTEVNLPETTREGYDFAGWKDKDGNVYTEDFDMPAIGEDGETLALTAQWNIKTFTIEFNTLGGSSIASITKQYGETISVADPTKEGNDFAYWYTTDEAVEYVLGSTMPDLGVDGTTLTLKAKWNVKQYTITFNSNGGSDVESITADYNSIISKPEDPTKEGFKFGYWYEEGSPNTQYTFSKMPAKNFTLYAKWNNSDHTDYKVIVHTMNTQGSYDEITTPLAGETGAKVYFDDVKPTLGAGFEFSKTNASDVSQAITADGKMVFNIYVDRLSYNFKSVADGVEGNQQKVLFGAQVPQLEDASKTGYNFNYWYKVEGSEFDLSTETMPAEDLTLTAKFTAKNYSGDKGVKFDANKGEFADKTTYKYVDATFAQPVTAPTAPTRYGYKFKGWAASDAEGAAIVAAPGAKLPALSVDLDKDTLTYFAVWEVETYTKAVTFDAMGGKFANEAEQFKVTATFGQAVSAPVAPTKAGYDFAGWAASDADDAPIVAAPGADLPALTIDLDEGTLTYYAKWNVTGDTSYNIVIYKMDVEGRYSEDSRVPKTGNCDSDVLYADAILNVVIDDGFKADTESSDTSKTITSDGKMEFKIYIARETYDAVFTAEGGFSETVPALYGATIVPPTAPKITGKRFDKWVDASEAEPSTMPLNGITFTAVYENKSCNVNYYVGGEYVGTKPVEYGSVIPASCVGVYDITDGYDLDGWYIGSINGAKLEDGAIMTADEINLYGVEVAITYNITFNANGGKFADGKDEFKTTASLEDSKFDVPEDPTRTGYFFIGWDPEVGELSVAGDKTFTAIWDADPDGFMVKFMQLKDETNPTLGYELYEEIPFGVGDYIEAPADPEALPEEIAAKYYFVGWSKTADSTENVLSADEVCELVMGESDEVFYAVFSKYPPKEFDVTYNVYEMNLDGEYDVSNPLTYKEKVTEDTVIYSADFSVYNGFTLDVDKSTESVTVVDDTSVMNIYLARNKYNINYYLTESDENPAYVQEVYFGDVIVLAGETKAQELIAASTDDAIKYGKYFYDWDYEWEFEYMPEAPAGLKVVANLRDKEFTVKFVKRLVNEDGINDDSKTETVVYYYGDEVKAPNGYESEIGYSFDNWTTEVPFTVGKDTPESQTIYAVHNINLYTIRFFLDDDAFDAGTPYKAYDGVDNPKLPFETDLEDYIPNMTDAKEGYTFDGWDVDPMMVEEEDADYIAQWTPIKYAYHFVANGSDFASGTADFDSAISAVVPTGKPTAPDGYKFAGWSTTNGGTTKVTDFGKISTDIAKNTFYAIFVEDTGSTTVDVKFFEYDGSNEHGPATGNIKEVIVKDCAKQFGETTEPEIGSKLILPETEPVLANYKFAGWFDADGNEWTDDSVIPNAELNLYAKYIRVQCGLIAIDGSTTVIERGSTDKLNNLDDVASYTAESVWYVYGLKVKLSETDLLGKYVTVAGDCRIELVRSSKNFYGTGSTITVIDNITNEVVEKFYIIIFGDIDGSGTIVSKDTTMCSEEELGITTWSLKKTSSYDPIKVKAADLNGDGRIKSKDTTIISEKELGTGDINQVTGRYMEVKI